MKKIISLVLVAIFTVSCFSISAHAATLTTLDLAFVIDTTMSMFDDIEAVKDDMTEYLMDLDESGVDYRIAIIDYRDFYERTGYDGDYPYNIAMDFSADYDAILSGIRSLSLGYGGDWRETIYSALIDGLDKLSWREEAGKAVILMGDAPALDPEPYTQYTGEQAISKLLYDDVDYTKKMRTSGAIATFASVQAQSEKRSAVTLFSIATDADVDVVECFESLSEGTGGKNYIADDATEITEIIEEILDVIPDIVEDNKLSFGQKLLNFLKKVFWFFTFQWKKIWPPKA